MKKNNMLTRLVTLLLAAFTVLTVTVMAAGVGSSDDPLVTLSYLNETFLPQVLRAVDEKITERNTQLAGALSDQIRIQRAAIFKIYISIYKNKNKPDKGKNRNHGYKAQKICRIEFCSFFHIASFHNSIASSSAKE